MHMTWQETKKHIAMDVYRNLGSCTKKDVLKALVSNTTLGLLVYFRVCHYLAELKRKSVFQKLLHGFCYLRFKSLQNKCGVELNQHTRIGYGLRLPHKGGIIIHPLVVIGKNCEIMQGVTVGNNILKNRDGVAVIGDEVLLCAGAKIIGKVHIGNGVVVGANAVVNRDVEDSLIVGGIPAKVLGTSDGRHVINKRE